MTTCIAIQSHDKAIIGADSLISGNGRNYIDDDTVKVTERKGYIIACAGDVRALQVIIYTWQPPAPIMEHGKWRGKRIYVGCR